MMLSKPNKSALPARLRTAAALLFAVAAATTVFGQAAPQLGAPPTPPGKSGKPTPYTLSGVYTVIKGDKPTAKTFSSDTKDVSAIYVKSGGDLTLTDAVVTTTAESSSTDNSTQFGLNAAVLAGHGGKIKITAGSITTAGAGANAVYAAGANVTLSKTTISTTGEASHGVIASGGGTIAIADMDIATAGADAAAIATDKGGGNITVASGTITTAGDKSPAIYDTGTIKVTGATLTATSAEGAILDGKATLTLIDAKLTGQKNHGVMFYQTTPTQVAGLTSSFNMKGGDLTAADGPLFFVTNTTATIFVTGATLTASGGTLVKAASDAWGTGGSNGGTANFTADHETLAGDFITEAPSSIIAKLQNETTLNGKVKGAAVSLDASSIWTVTDDSTITVLADAQGAPGGAFTNIVGNGHDVHYDASLTGNAWLKGKTYELSSGGKLRPIAGTNHNSNNPNNNNNNNTGRGYGGGPGGGGYGGGGGGGGGGHH